MTGRISFFRVGNGDMTLLRPESGAKILLDCNIRAAADDPDDVTPDVGRALRERLERDDDGRLYLDAFVLSHPDQDHCGGLRRHFHLGPPDQWSKEDDKILIRELWSSPMVFRRASKSNPLCADAKAFNTESKRRVKAFFGSNWRTDGNRILILGEDEDGKTDGLEDILVHVGDEIPLNKNSTDRAVEYALLLGPPAESGDSDMEKRLSKNNSSVILNFSLAGGGKPDQCRFLTGGDAGVAVWEELWEENKDAPDFLEYDILLAPHHCSWHSLSHDSWSECGEDAKVSKDARRALSQARSGATIVASSDPIRDDKNDPPCIRAKREYTDIVGPRSGEFRCVGVVPSGRSPSVLEFDITISGHQCLAVSLSAFAGGLGIGNKPWRHG